MIKYVNDNEFIEDTLSSLNETDRLNTLRKEREKLFPAFNIYCTMKNANCLPTTYATNDIEHEEILEWYAKILDLDEEAIFNIPKQVRYFLDA